MRLYYAPGACSLSPHIVVRELGLDVEMEKVVFGDGVRTTEPHNENYYEVNPRGYVPALRIDSGEVIVEGVAIVQYLADQAPDKNLMPKQGSEDYYRALEWLTFISSEMHKGFGATFRKDIPEDEKTKAIDKLKTRISWVNTALEGKDYLVGNTFTIADAYCFAILRWHPRANLNLADYPNVHAYYERVGARPMVAKALEEEGVKMYA